MWRPEFTLNRQEALSGAVRTEASQRKMQIAVRRGSAIVWAVLRFFLIFGLSFIIVYPLLYMLSVSFREPSELFDPTVVWIPKSFTLENIRYVLEVIDYPKAVGKTLSIALSCSLVQTLTCAIAGYGFARFRFRGRGLLFTLALFTLIVPPQTITMPLYINYVDFTAWTAELSGGSGIPMLDTILPLFLPALFGTGIRAGLFIYLCRQYFRNMPLEMEDAAYRRLRPHRCLLAHYAGQRRPHSPGVLFVQLCMVLERLSQCIAVLYQCTPAVGACVGPAGLSEYSLFARRIRLLSGAGGRLCTSRVCLKNAF